MSIPKQLLEETEQRYVQRQSDREEIRQKIDSGLLLQADSPKRVEKRLKRLGVEHSAAKALAGSDLTSIPPTVTGTTPDFDSIALERIIRKSDLMSVNYLEFGLQVSRSVGRIRIQTATRRIAGYGTGFMVSPQLLVTNNHVLPNRQVASFSQVEFNFQDGTDGQPLLSVIFNLDPGVFFLTDKDLDYTLVAVRGNRRDGFSLSSFGWNPLVEEEGKVILGEYLNIIQHPNGEPKQLALRENQLIDVLPDFLHYQTDTAPGSSGSPVFNDQWEVVALHHSGVPRKDDQGRILSIDGTPWTEEQGEQRIDWIANEGARISRLVRHIKQQNLSFDEQNLRNQMFEQKPIPSRSQPPEIMPESTSVSPTISNDGSVTWTIPLQVSVRLGQPTITGNSSSQSPQQSPVPQDLQGNQALDEALAQLQAARSRTYYDKASDELNRDKYYDKILAKFSALNETELFQELSKLVKQTHKNTLSYSPSKHLYPWVDLQPNTKLQSIYSERELDPEEVIRQDFQIEQERSRQFRELVLAESVMSTEQIAKQLEQLEASMPFNCEHVVPQSWFNKKEPMRGDLHHLFSCEPNCNSFRGNNPYFDFPDFNETIRNDCGKLLEKKFEPSGGKGATARATLYFLLRYPGEINKTSKEYQEERLETLLKWHKAYPVTQYEKHRNMAIFEKQGNRNPLIDFPEWADKIAFGLGLG
jgi:endonuclease I/V8-like Glu-specific endopeptidase